MKTEKAKKETKVEVVQEENEEPVTAEVIAQSIKKLSDAVDAMNKAGLSGRAIRVLLRDASRESMTSIHNILNGMRDLRRLYLKD